MTADDGMGKVAWYALVTPDAAGAREFYTRIFGWQWRVETMAGLGDYPLFEVDGTVLGGILPPEPADKPAHWLLYVTVPDVEAAAVAVARCGGKVLTPPRDMPGFGRSAVVADPSGAVVAPFESWRDASATPAQPAPAGHFCWHELLTADVEAGAAFYTTVFGWSAQKDAIPGLGTYTVFRRGEAMTAGMLAMPAGAAAAPHWLPYVAVDDVAAAAARVTEAGGAVPCPPTDIPGLGRFAVATDPQGAAFAVFRSV